MSKIAKTAPLRRVWYAKDAKTPLQTHETALQNAPSAFDAQRAAKNEPPLKSQI